MINFNRWGWIDSSIGNYIHDNMTGYFTKVPISIINWPVHSQFPNSDYKFVFKTFLENEND